MSECHKFSSLDIYKGSQNFFDKYLFCGHTFCSTNPLMTNTVVNLSFYETVMRIMMWRL